MREIPPTAGLPLQWHDLMPGQLGGSLEDGLAQFLGVPAVQVESSGTAALIIALECLKRLSPRREVIVPAYTCPLLALAVAQSGLDLKLCDHSPDSFDMDPAALSALCDKNTLCIIPTHMAGLPADLDPVLKIARDSGAYVIEDAAQSLGATWQGKPAGTVGDIGFFSLTCGKGLSIGEGGFLVARDPAIRRNLLQTSQSLVPSRLFAELGKAAFVLAYTGLYNPAGLSIVYRAPLRQSLKAGDLIRAAGDHFDFKIPIHKVGHWRKQVGASGLTRLPSFISSNAERGRRRAAQLNEIPGVNALTESPSTAGSWPFIFVQLEAQELRDAALSRLWPSGLGVTRLFIHDLTGYEYLSSIVPRSIVPNAGALAARSFTISNSPWLSDRDFDVILETLLSLKAAGREPASGARLPVDS